MWSFLGGGGGEGAAVNVPPSVVTNIEIAAGNSVAKFTWDDPEDIFAEGVNVNEWVGTTIIVNKEHVPANQNDGQVLYTSNVRDQHKTEPYVAEGLDIDVKYFYAIFPFSKYGVYNTNSSQTGEFTVMSVPPVKPLNQYTWAEIEMIANAGTVSEDGNHWVANGETYFTLKDKTAPVSFGDILGNQICEISGFLHDTASDNKGKVPISFMFVDCGNAKYRISSQDTWDMTWKQTDMKSFVDNTLLSVIPEDLKNVITPVDKAIVSLRTSSIYEIKYGTSENELLWIPSLTELAVETSNYRHATEGTAYPIFTDNQSRIKKFIGSPSDYWVRTPWMTNNSKWEYIYSIYGDTNTDDMTELKGVVVGFCIGKGRI